VLLFPATENVRKRKSVTENTFFCSLISFRSFVFGLAVAARRQSWARSTRRFRRLTRSLWYNRYRRFCIFRNCTNEKTEKLRRFSKNPILRVDKLQSEELMSIR